jgi:hypothetical protein
MRIIALAFVYAFVMASSVSCSVNILSTFADKYSDESLYYDARTLIDGQQYDLALDKISQMSTTYAASESVIVLKAQAYAGKCGLNFLTFVADLTDIGSARLFPFLVKEFVGGSTDRIDACRTAEDLVESIGDVSARTTDENFLLALVSFAKIGNVLSLYTDADQDGNADTGVDVCNYTPLASRPSSPATGDWTAEDLGELGTGIVLAIDNLSAVSSSISVGSSSIDTIGNVCGLLTGPLAAYDFCSVTDPTAFTSDELKGIRSMLNEDADVGLGTNCTGDISACACP